MKWNYRMGQGQCPCSNILDSMSSMDLSHAWHAWLSVYKEEIKMGKTISMSVGRLAPLHDVRLDISANVDTGLTYRNAVFIDKLADFNYSIEAYTDAKFQDAIDEYNQKQVREDRKKRKAYSELLADENQKIIEQSKRKKEKGLGTSSRKPTKLAHEYVLQIGDRISDGTLDPRTALDEHKKIAYEALMEMQKKYPHVDILLATFHADEPNGTPHMHIIVQFTGDGYKQGLSRQVSMSKALELDGFERSNNRGDYAINRWCEDVKNTILEPKMCSIMQEKRKELGEHRKHEDIRVFREKAKKEELAIQEKQEALESHVKSQEDRLNRIYNSLVSKRDELENESAEILEREEQLESRKMALDKKEIQLDSFSERASDMFNEALELLESSKKIYRALSQEQQMLYNKQLVKLNEQLLPHSRKIDDKQYSL